MGLEVEAKWMPRALARRGSKESVIGGRGLGTTGPVTRRAAPHTMRGPSVQRHLALAPPPDSDSCRAPVWHLRPGPRLPRRPTPLAPCLTTRRRIRRATGAGSQVARDASGYKRRGAWLPSFPRLIPSFAPPDPASRKTTIHRSLRLHRHPSTQSFNPFHTQA